MKRKNLFSVFLVILFVFCTLLPLGAQPNDFVVLLDVSESVFRIFDDLVNYLIRDALLYQVDTGDTVHLLKFNSHTEEVLEQDIASPEDVEQVIRTVMLLQPLGRYTDLIGAFQTLYNYTLGLPSGKEKTILILTDGIHDPPPGSNYQMTEAEAREWIRKIGENIKRQGWDVHIVQLPKLTEEIEAGAGDTQDQGANIIGDFTEPLDIDAAEYEPGDNGTISSAAFGSPSITFPGHLGKVGSRFKIPLEVKNYSDGPLLLKLRSILHEGTDILRKPVSTVVEKDGTALLKPVVSLPKGFEGGEHEISLELLFDENIKPIPNTGIISFTLKKSAGDGRKLNSSIVMVALLILVIIAGVLILFFVIRKLLARSSTAAGKQARIKYEEKVLSDKTGHKPIELFVSGQNHHIGLRNVHVLHPGQTRSVGGRSSQFLIFLVDFPRHIGELSFDGNNYTFTPRKGEFFPTVSKPVKNCLGKTITAVSDAGYKVRFLFREYISPLTKINQIMHLTDKPGRN